MQITAEAIRLELKTPFVIAHGTSTTRENVLVHLGTSVGEAALTPYYPTRPPDVLEYVQRPEVADAMDRDIEFLEDILEALPPGPPPAKAALDMALHDHWGKRLRQPLYRLWGLNPARAPISSITIGITQDEQEFRDKLRAVRNAPLIKLKLGSGNLLLDEALVRVAREESEAMLCVDANAGWTAEEALAIIPKIAGYRLLFVEQPVGHSDYEGWRTLKAGLPPEMPPLIADESVHSPFDVLQLYNAADGINIKLAKCGGLRKARRMIGLARSLKMKVMLGCMVESSVALSAAAHLAPLVDYADLDGNLDVTNDPFIGARWDDGLVIPPDRPGLGVLRR